ncbi:MAG TPA: class I adenylate-forming enzyme family protein, partial [Phycicoccus sp.]|nr:class I adenylate-forming enzyme family protein [Phycicoccus sp.]
MRLHPPERVAEYETMGLWGVPLWTERLAQWCRSRGDALALIDPPNLRALMGLASARYTWSEVADRAGHLADVLARHGIGRDDVVGVQLPNCADLAVTYLALSSLGAIATPFPMQYREYELRQMCELAGASAFLGAADFLGASREAILRELKAAHGIREVFTLGGREVPGCRDLTTALRMPSGPDRAAPPVERRARGLASLDPNDAVTICWTSGTEATPKGVPRCPNDWEPMGLTSVDAMGLGEDDVILNPFPMVNMAGIGGMFVPWLLSGSTLVLHHPFDAAIFFGQIQCPGDCWKVLLG